MVPLGIIDPLIGVFVIGPRMPDARTRRIVLGGLVGSGALLVVLGLLLLAGVVRV